MYVYTYSNAHNYLHILVIHTRKDALSFSCKYLHGTTKLRHNSTNAKRFMLPAEFRLGTTEKKTADR